MLLKGQVKGCSVEEFEFEIVNRVLVGGLVD
jgi:hypothetical protein